MHKHIYLLLLLTLFFITVGAQPVYPYKNPALTTEERVKDLLSRMTIEEKFWQLFMISGEMRKGEEAKYKNGIFGFQVGAGAQEGNTNGQMLNYNSTENAVAFVKKINAMQHYFVEGTRLGIPIIPFDEALHGLVRGGATSFPQAIALAATFDTVLMHDVSTAIMQETKLRGIRDILTPVVNIAGDVRWGRVEETYGEDPFLTSEMGVAFVKPFEQNGIVTTPKHFVANFGDGGRDSYPIHVNERLLREVYFPPFKACIERGGSRSVMMAYNSVDGLPTSASEWLQQTVLKKDWQFNGFIISDANAVAGADILHYTSPNIQTSSQQAISAGLDVIFQTEYDHYKLFIPPFLNGSIPMQRINDAVSRVLRAKFELGLFDHPYVNEDSLLQNLQAINHKALAKKAAVESMVLLKNDSQLLPLNTNIKTLALIGVEATEARLGGYSSQGNGKVNILDGIKQKLPSANIIYTPGCGRKTEEWTVIADSFFKSGLQAQYYNNIALSGTPVIERKDRNINFHWTLYSPDPKVNLDFYSARWQGSLTAPQSGTFKIGLDGNDGYRLYINNKLVINRWQKETYTTSLVDYRFEKNKTYDITVEFYEPRGNATLKLVWNVGVPNNWQEQIREAVTAAQKSDVAVIAVGIHEGEFQDRAMLSLPGHQEEMINAVAATGKPVVVLLVGGSAITMNNWLRNVHSVLDIWYPGEEGGNAVADVLFGIENPAGRLPLTFPISEAQLPLVYNHKPTGRGDDYYNLSGLPLFPFGYGLSYTTFAYSNLSFSKNNITATDSVTATCTVKNTGKREGDEVVQLYIRDVIASVSQPVIQLKGFSRIHLQPGESKQVSFTIYPNMLSMLDKDLHEVVEPGDFRIMVGPSSLNIQLKETLTVK